MTNNLPLVCICIPTYNAAATIRETLESILAQTYANLVIYISDNGSTDETLKVVESIADTRIHIYRLEKNIGAEGNFNQCIQLAVGEYTAIFHADDVYESQIVAKQVACLEANPMAGAVFTEASLIDDRSNKIGEMSLPKGIIHQGGLYDFETMFKAVLHHSNFFICPSFMVRTRIYHQEIKVWRGDLFGSGADLDVWLRILEHHPLAHIPEKLMQYRISNNQFSAQVRLETEPGLIFKIIDYYLEKTKVQEMLDANDLLNYKWLERRDRVIRALNLFLLDFPQKTKQLLRDIYTWDTLKAAFLSRRGMVTLILGVYIKLLVAMDLRRVGKTTLIYMKHVTRR